MVNKISELYWSKIKWKNNENRRNRKIL